MNHALLLKWRKLLLYVFMKTLERAAIDCRLQGNVSVFDRTCLNIMGIQHINSLMLKIFDFDIKRLDYSKNKL